MPSSSGTADAVFVQYQEEAEAVPADWRGWFRLGAAYAAAGDRKRARASMRVAIAHHAGQGRS
jgi:Flp pilus assembly protein TadD